MQAPNPDLGPPNAVRASAKEYAISKGVAMKRRVNSRDEYQQTISSVLDENLYPYHNQRVQCFTSMDYALVYSPWFQKYQSRNDIVIDPLHK